MKPPGDLLRAARQQARESGRIIEAERWETRLRLLVDSFRSHGQDQAVIDLEEALDELSRRKA